MAIKIPHITVLMPVYNCELYIREAVDSILNQTFNDFEILIIDDCSTDKTLEICKSFKDERVVIIRKEKNTGYTNSLNYGLSLAKGNYIARMDGDDISLPERFEKQVAFMDANPDVAVCGTAFRILGTDISVSVPEIHDVIKVGMLKECKIAHPSVMMRHVFLKQNNISYNPSYEPAEDYDLWVRISRIGKLHNLQEILILYRVHEAQVSDTKNQNQKDKATSIKINLLSYLDADISDNEKQAYINMLQSMDEIAFSDFQVFLELKKRLISLNANNFFSKPLFRTHFLELENKYISLYFKNNKSYSLQLYFEYLKIFNAVYAKLTWWQSTKLFVKCLLFYKVKSSVPI